MQSSKAQNNAPVVTLGNKFPMHIGPYKLTLDPRGYIRVRGTRKTLGKESSRFFPCDEQAKAILWAAEAAKGIAEGKPVEPPRRESDSSIAAAIAAYLDDRKAEVGAGQLKLIGIHLDKFLARYRWTPIDQVDPLECRKWLRDLKLAQRTKHGIFTTCRTFYRWAMRYDLATRSPFERMEPIPKGEAPREILTPHQMRTALDAARQIDACLVNFLVLGGFCGLRPCEVMRLRWKDINFETGEIHIRPDVIKRDKMRGRGMRERYVTIPATARRFLIPERNTMVIPMGDRNFQYHFKKIVAALDLKTWPHDCLRHSAASYALADWDSADRVAKWLGHTTTKMVYENYARAVPVAQAREWWAIGAPEVLPDESRCAA